MSAKIPPGQAIHPFKQVVEEGTGAVSAWSNMAEASGRAKIVDTRVEELDRFDQYRGKRVIICKEIA